MEEWAKIHAVCANLVKNYRKRTISSILRSAFPMYQILLSCNTMQMNSYNVIFWIFVLDSINHSWKLSPYDNNYRLLHALQVGKPAKSAVYQTLIPTVWKSIYRSIDLIFLVSTEQRKLYRFETTWWCVCN